MPGSSVTPVPRVSVKQSNVALKIAPSFALTMPVIQLVYLAPSKRAAMMASTLALVSRKAHPNHSLPTHQDLITPL
jgi:hypothetical protein